MSKSQKRPILFHGEQLGRPGERPAHPPMDKKYPRTYEEALELVQDELENVVSDVDKMPETQRTSEVVLTVKLAKGFLAKSYTPDTFFKQMNLVPIGSKLLKEDGVEKRLHFVRTYPEDLKEDASQISQEKSVGFKDDLRKIDGLSVKDDVYDKVVGLDDLSASLIPVEIVLHALGRENKVEANKKFQALVGNDTALKIVTYEEDGPTFIYVKLTKDKIAKLSQFNPLRTAHPFQFRMLQDPFQKVTPVPSMLEADITDEEIEQLPVVGVFDGGTDRTNDYLKPFVIKEIPLVTSISEIEHGSLVAGTVIYGSQNIMDGVPKLIPHARILSVKAFPESNEQDPYDIITGIERVVAANPKIDVFNISFGPDAPIDDEVDRFTYSIDRMAYKWHKLFVVAVGNSGEQPDILKRIQAPSDAVNALSVGAYCRDQINQLNRAPYSSIGPGREGGKIKPDILGLGGSRDYPLNLVGQLPNALYQTSGTSFAAPEVATKAASLLADINEQEIDFLAAKALLVNGADLPGKNATDETGWGILSRNSESLLTSDETSVTVVFQGSTFSKVYTNLRIPVPKNIEASKVQLTWTTVTLAKPEANSSEAYTQVALEETLYPDNSRLSVSGNPKSKSANIYPVNASEKRRRDFYVWDTTVKHSKTMLPKSLEQPYLRVHAMTRDSSEIEVRYAIAMRVDVKNYDGDLYDDIRNEFKVLTPIQLNTRVQQRL